MKITLVYSDIGSDAIFGVARIDYYEGIGSLSASLKQAGHVVSLLYYTQLPAREAFVQNVVDTSPDIIGFSSTSLQFHHIRVLARWLEESGRTRDIPTICGGVHATMAPEEVIRAEGIDFICRGEGEAALLELCHRLQQGGDPSNIANLWYRRGNSITRNPVRPPVDLDTLPLPDRQIFEIGPHPPAGRSYAKAMLSRGCPFACPYCSNAMFLSLYGGSSFVRRRSVDSAMAYLRALLQHHRRDTTINFSDQVFNLDRRWMRAFVQRYPREIGRPFSVQLAFRHLCREDIQLLAQAGCIAISFGLETGDPTLRQEVLHRQETEQQILQGAQWCKEAGISLILYNIVGLPGESLRSVLNTIRLNARLGPKRAMCSIFYPFPATALHELCREAGYLTSREVSSMDEDTRLDLPTITRQQVRFALHSFRQMVRLFRLAGELPQPARALAEKALEHVYLSHGPAHLALALASRAVNGAFKRRARLETGPGRDPVAGAARPGSDPDDGFAQQ